MLGHSWNLHSLISTVQSSKVRRKSNSKYNKKGRRRGFFASFLIEGWKENRELVTRIDWYRVDMHWWIIIFWICLQNLVIQKHQVFNIYYRCISVEISSPYNSTLNWIVQTLHHSSFLLSPNYFCPVLDEIKAIWELVTSCIFDMVLLK